MSIYLTTPIYYVNDRPHIGHCYTTIVTDALARLSRLLGHDTFFLTGTDEHGQKVEKSAEARNISPQALADENARHFQDAMQRIGSSHNDFIRTTQPRHTRQVQAALKQLISTGDVYLGTFEGWYDEGQEEYVTENQAREKNYLAFNGKPLSRAKEQNYYFRLSKWQPALEALFDAHPHFVQPAARFNEVRGRLRDGLQDVPVSRTNFSWGIPVPDAQGHVTYVWIDALLNYASALGLIDRSTPERHHYWPANAHLIGKEILWFHAVIWPALLMALRLPTPRRIYAHSFWVADGVKMSKTLGNFIDLDKLTAYTDRFGLDAVRWYLLTQGPLRETDADFSYTKFVEVFNADLASGVGNCASRVGNMIEKYFAGIIPQHASRFRFTARDPDLSRPQNVKEDLWNTLSEDFPERTSAIVAQVERDFDALDIASALSAGRRLIASVDQFISIIEPFKLAKLVETDPSKKAVLGSVLYCCAEAVRIASLLLCPSMPFKMTQLWQSWNCSPLNDQAEFRAPLRELALFAGPHGLKPGQSINKGEGLFMRADPKLPPPGSAVSA
jgi:methionyl-tRNA synthetase